MRFFFFRSSSSRNLQSKSEEPFFQKEGENTFFKDNQTSNITEPFFTPGRTPVAARPAIQPKLTVGKPNDKYEQEADTTADRVVKQINGRAAAPPTVQAKCDTCEKEDKKREEEGVEEQRRGGELQRKPVFESAGEPPEEGGPGVMAKPENNGLSANGNGSGLQSRLNSTQGKGQPLPEQTRASMESAMGSDFSGVRVHNGREADEMNQGLRAQAFTHGRDIYFREGKYNPQAEDGQRLLAHELAHVVQQGGNNIMRASEDSTPSPEKRNESVIETKTEWIVEDNTREPLPGQMQKTTFLNNLQSEVCAVVDEALVNLPYSSEACPYIRKSFLRFRAYTPGQIQQIIEKYAPATREARSALELIHIVKQHAGTKTRQWAMTGDLGALPPDVAGSLPTAVRGLARFNSIFSAMGNLSGNVMQIAKDMGAGLANQATKALSFVKGIFFKAKQGGIQASNPGVGSNSAMSSGQPLNPGSRKQMESALSGNFSDVRIHTDQPANQFSENLNARAFTVGKDIGFGKGEYRPGTLLGDALLAHELAHVQQQSQGGSSDDTEVLEKDADEAAARAILHPMRGEQGEGKVSKGSGLQLMRCGGEPIKGKYKLYSLKKEFHGNPFQVNLSWMSSGRGGGVVYADIFYRGTGQPSKNDINLEINIPQIEDVPTMQLVTNDETSLIFGDFGGQGQNLSLTAERFQLDESWAPPSHSFDLIFRFSTSKAIIRTFEPNLTIKQRDAVPASEKPLIDQADKVPALKGLKIQDPEIGLQLMKLRLEGFLRDPLLKSLDLWSIEILLRKINEDLTKVQAQKTTMSQAELDEIARHTRDLEETFAATGPVIKNLSLMAHKEGYLPDIADAAVREVYEVMGLFFTPLFMSYASREQADKMYDTAQEALLQLPHKISALYLSNV